MHPEQYFRRREVCLSNCHTTVKFFVIKMRLFSILATIFVVVACLNEGQVVGIQVVFDNSVDLGKLAAMDCSYNENYHDFLANGCERSPSEDVYPERTGFWTGCTTGCELIYNGGKLPKPAKLRVASYIEGDAYISISGKNSQDDPNFEHDFGTIESQEEAHWCFSEIDLADFSKPDTSVINFSVAHSTNGYVLIDQVVVDLSADTIDPISIDTKDDELPMHWSYDDCHNVQNYTEFNATVCPVVPIEGNPIHGAIGYWTPCIATNCTIQFLTSPSIIPSSLRIRGYVEDDAQFKVMIPQINYSNHPNNGPVVIKTISSPNAVGGWVDFEVDLSPYNLYKIDVVLDRARGGVAMLDSLSYGFGNIQKVNPLQSELPMCSPRSTTTEEPTSTSTVGTGASSAVAASTAIFLAFCASTSLIL